MTHTENQKRRKIIETAIATVLFNTTGAVVEVTVSSSSARGQFVSLCGTLDDLDLARPFMGGVANARFDERDIDPDEDEQIDFYSIL
tara:strand:+ start:950 stop:1210 length:261 start_codon:yes stop_codon:yes gene_type:complete